MKWHRDLLTDIRTHSHFDDVDGVPNPYSGSRGEFTEENARELKSYFLKIRDRCPAILEIGVCRPQAVTSTGIFLDLKLPSTIYVGIDIDDKSFLNDASKNIHTIQNTSSDLTSNLARFKELGIKEFGFIFIDGWHSINAVLTEWEYTELLTPQGIIGFHDTNYHPGPQRFCQALDPNKFQVDILCPSDYGISFVTKKT